MHKKILIVEDDREIAEVLKDLLIDIGYNCTTAKNGAVGYSFVKSEKFDLIVSDFRMPVMSGSELLKEVRGAGFHVPFLFITANRQLPTEDLIALEDCCSSLLQKPLDVEELIQAVEKSILRVHTVNCQEALR